MTKHDYELIGLHMFLYETQYLNLRDSLTVL